MASGIASNQRGQRSTENVDTVGVTGSIPVSPTMTRHEQATKRHLPTLGGQLLGIGLLLDRCSARL